MKKNNTNKGWRQKVLSLMAKSGGWKEEKTTQIRDGGKKCCFRCRNQGFEMKKKQHK